MSTTPLPRCSENPAPDEVRADAKPFLKRTFLTGVLTGAVVATGILFVWNYLAPHEVVASSISPDSKWICEIVDIDPRGPVCEILIHGQAYQGYFPLKRGYGGECVVMDLDSSGPPDAKFEWNGPVVTITSKEIGEPVKLRCGERGAVIVRDETPAGAAE